MTTKEATGDLFTQEIMVGIDEILVDADKNIRPVHKPFESKMSNFIAAVGTNGVSPVEVIEKTGKGYPLRVGFQRIGAAGYIRDFLMLVTEMIPIREKEEKDSAEAGHEVVDDAARAALEKKHGELVEQYIKWTATDATKAKLAELRGAPEGDTPFTLKEIQELLTKWSARVTQVPIRISTIKDNFDWKLRQVSENIDRQDLTPMEEATAVHDLVEFFVEKKKMERVPAMEAVGQRLGGRGLSWVQQSLTLLKASAPVQEALSTGDVSKSQALAIVREKSAKGQSELLERAKKGATVRALEKQRKPAETKNNARNKKATQTRLVAGASLTAKVGKHEVKVTEGDDGEFTVTVDDETVHSFTITKKGSIKVSGSASEILNVKTEIGHVVVQHDPTTTERFSVDVDGAEVAEFMLDGKGDLEFKSIPKEERQKGAKVKGKQKSAARKAKAAK